jgi:phage FluMu protein Com
MMTPATVPQVQVRCLTCGRRLCDVANAIEAGRAMVEVKCTKCGAVREEWLIAVPAASDRAPRGPSVVTPERSERPAREGQNGGDA